MIQFVSGISINNHYIYAPNIEMLWNQRTTHDLLYNHIALRGTMEHAPNSC